MKQLFVFFFALACFAADTKPLPIPAEKQVELLSAYSAALAAERDELAAQKAVAEAQAKLQQIGIALKKEFKAGDDCTLTLPVITWKCKDGEKK